MEKLKTIQKRGNLNDVYAIGEKGNGGAYHEYLIKGKALDGQCEFNHKIQFQHGPRNEAGSQHGITTADLLEICRNQLRLFQDGEMATKEGAIALLKIEEALIWLNKRTEDRIERKVLGTMKK